MASRIKKQIELEPPKFPICKTETIKGAPTECILCNGAGGQYVDSRWPDFIFSKNNGSGYYVACKVCEGTGLVCPIIKIEWQSTGEIMEKYKTAIE